MEPFTRDRRRQSGCIIQAGSHTRCRFVHYCDKRIIIKIAVVVGIIVSRPVLSKGLRSSARRINRNDTLHNCQVHIRSDDLHRDRIAVGIFANFRVGTLVGISERIINGITPIRETVPSDIHPVFDIVLLRIGIAVVVVDQRFIQNIHRVGNHQILIQRQMGKVQIK